MGTSQWVFVRYPKTILCQGQVGQYEEMYQIKKGKINIPDSYELQHMANII